MTPKKFSNEERDWVQQKLLTEGRRCFETHGLKKTSVADLTNAAGISQGAFYLFYNSKEELLFELIQEDEKRIRGVMLESFEPGAPIDQRAIKQFLTQSFRMIDESPLLKGLIVKRELEQLMRKLPKEMLDRNFSEDSDDLMPLISLWQSNGIMRDAPPELIVSIIRSLILLTLHKEEIGESKYDATMELLFDVMAFGMSNWKLDPKGESTYD